MKTSGELLRVVLTERFLDNRHLDAIGQLRDQPCVTARGTQKRMEPAIEHADARQVCFRYVAASRFDGRSNGSASGTGTRGTRRRPQATFRARSEVSREGVERMWELSACRAVFRGRDGRCLVGRRRRLSGFMKLGRA